MLLVREEDGNPSLKEIHTTSNPILLLLLCHPLEISKVPKRAMIEEFQDPSNFSPAHPNDLLRNLWKIYMIWQK
jgi:hypothetical protein